MCVTYMIGACNGAFLTRPSDPGEGQISLYFKYSHKKDIDTNFVWVLTNKSQKHMEQAFHFVAGSRPMGCTLVCWGSKICDGAPSTVRSSWSCNYLNNVNRWLLYCVLASVSVCVLVYRLNRVSIWSVKLI